jgi:hypothetical protein
MRVVNDLRQGGLGLHGGEQSERAASEHGYLKNMPMRADEKRHGEFS